MPACFSRYANPIHAGRAQIRKEEGRTILAAGLLFFVLLTVVMILRPVREALGLSRGIESVRHLFYVTLAATLLLAPLFGWLVSRVSRRRLLSVSFRICALILLGFFMGHTLLPGPFRSTVAAVYYVYHSVFNLFVVSLFWAFMADLFSLAESKRLFPAIAIGGTLGAIFGSLISWQLADLVGVGSLFLFAAVLLELAVRVATLVTRARAVCPTARYDSRPVGGHVLRGITAVVKSPYILGIAGFILLVGVVSTFLYFTGLQLVAATTASVEHRTATFAHINIWTQVATLLAQAFLAGLAHALRGRGKCLGPPACLGCLWVCSSRRSPDTASFHDCQRSFPGHAARNHPAGPRDPVHRLGTRGQIQS